MANKGNGADRPGTSAEKGDASRAKDIERQQGPELCEIGFEIQAEISIKSADNVNNLVMYICHQARVTKQASPSRQD